MWTRITLIVLGLFWAAMLGLLCWSEFGGQRHLGTGASVETVWNKILTCPDSSALSVKVNGESVGYCSWKPEIIEGGVKSTGSEDVENLEGMIREVLGYNISISSSFDVPAAEERFRVGASIEFDKEKDWTTLELSLRNNDQEFGVQTSAAEQNLEWTSGGETLKMGYDQLRDPTKLLGRFGGPLAALALSNLPFLPAGGNTQSLAASIKWQASYSWIRILNQRVRCYELNTRIFDNEIKVFVSLVGEILRVELPNEIELVNTTETQM